MVKFPCLLLAPTVMAVGSQDPVEPAQEARRLLEEAGASIVVVEGEEPWVSVALHIGGREAGDAVLAHLERLPVVTELNLGRTRVSDAGMQRVGRLPGLRKLDLHGTAVGDAGLAHLGDLDQLEVLNLYGTRVTDAGLEYLAGLPELRKLFLWKTAVTREGAAALRARRPELKINLGARLPSADRVIESRSRKVRFVRIELPGAERILSLAEVEVLADGRNLALGAPARQSSTAYGGEAARAVDGDPDGAYGGGSVTHTATEQDPWWEVDLGSEFAIDSIRVANRSDDGLHARLDGFRIVGLDAGREEVFSKMVEEAPASAGTYELKSVESGAEAADERVVLEFNPGSCCDEAQKRGETCAHPCCEAAAAKGEICKRCNPG